MHKYFVDFFSQSQSQSQRFFITTKIGIIHRMTQRLKPIGVYLSHKYLPLFTIQWPHLDDNSVCTGARTEAVRPRKLRHSRHKLHWNRSTDSSAICDGKTATTMAAPLQWTTMMPNIKVWKYHSIYITLRNISHQCSLWGLKRGIYAINWFSGR